MARKENSRVMPFYFDDFEDATTHLTDKQKWIYFRMIWWQFHNKAPFKSSEHARKVLSLSSRDCVIIDTLLTQFCVKTDTGWLQNRTFEEIEKIASKSELARESANRRWKNNDANALLEEKRREEKRREDKKHTKKEAFLSDSFFEDFYNLYPKKIGRQTAIKAYEKAVKKTTHEIIMQGLARYKKHISEKNTETQFIKHPATWLNGGCWDDDYCMKPIQNGKPVFQAYTDEAWEGRKSGEYILDPETNELIFKELS